MAVSDTFSPSYTALRGLPGLYHWQAGGAVSGDATGGSATLTIRPQGVREVTNRLWLLKTFLTYVTVAGSGVPTLDLTLPTTGEGNTRLMSIAQTLVAAGGVQAVEGQNMPKPLAWYCPPRIDAVWRAEAFYPTNVNTAVYRVFASGLVIHFLHTLEQEAALLAFLAAI